MTEPTRQRLTILPVLSLALLAAQAADGQTLYSFGNPGPDEQAYIELINRARANPPAEGARLAATTDPKIVQAYQYFEVDLVKMRTEFNAIPAAPPLAPNGRLTTAARGHSQWMFDTRTFDHFQGDSGPGDRIEHAGYVFWTWGENIANQAFNPWHGHASFEVDWGNEPDGMQTDRGHRTTIHSPDVREIGVGVVNGTNGTFGPQVVTQDFGEPWDAASFGTGVAYYDLNANDFYDAGEGISGLAVNVSGASHYCTTATGGGWAVPIPQAAATRTVTFSGLGISQTRSLAVQEDNNAKADLKLAYTPPSITSGAAGMPGQAHAFSFTAVGGAAGYRWDRWNAAPAAGENCESLANANVTKLGTYEVRNTEVKQQGSASWHLVNPGVIGEQFIELKALFHGGAAPSLAFQSWLRATTTSERYEVQVKPEGATVWQDVYSQTGGTAEGGFSLKSVPLAAMQGKVFRVRFLLGFPSGSTYSNTGDAFGWFIDSISFAGVSELANPVSQTLSGTSGSFTPAAGNYLLAVTPLVSGNPFPGASQVFTVQAPATGYSSWAATAETSGGLAAGTIAGSPAGDHDKDGRANLVEYAFGTSPVAGNEPSPRHPAMQANATHFVLRYVRDTSLTDVTLVPVATSDFSGWKSPGQSGAPAGFTDAPVSTAGGLETREARIPLGSAAGVFVKIAVIRN